MISFRRYASSCDSGVRAGVCTAREERQAAKESEWRCVAETAEVRERRNEDARQYLRRTDGRGSLRFRAVHQDARRGRVLEDLQAAPLYCLL